MNSIIEAQIELREQQKLLPEHELRYVRWFQEELKSYRSAIENDKFERKKRLLEEQRDYWELVPSPASLLISSGEAIKDIR